MQDANWVIKETKTAHFGDKRLNKRYEKLVDSLGSHPVFQAHLRAGKKP